VAPTYLQQERGRASAPDSASRGLDDDSRANWQRRWCRKEEESRGSCGYCAQPSARQSSAACPTRQPAVEDRRGDTETVLVPRGSEGTDALERLTIQQYLMMIREADQARDDAMKAQNLAEAARTRRLLRLSRSRVGAR